MLISHVRFIEQRATLIFFLLQLKSVRDMRDIRAFMPKTFFFFQRMPRRRCRCRDMLPAVRRWRGAAMRQPLYRYDRGK
jgi:hypothetical protein